MQCDKTKEGTAHLNEFGFSVEDFLKPLRVAVNVVVHHVIALIYTYYNSRYERGTEIMLTISVLPFQL